MAAFAQPVAVAEMCSGVDRGKPAEAGVALSVAGGVEDASFWMLWYLECHNKKWACRGQWVDNVMLGPLGIMRTAPSV